MADTYQLSQFATAYAFEKQTAMGTDPALARLHAPGAVFVMDPKENYNKEKKKPLGTRNPGPHFHVAGMSEYGHEVQMTLSEEFSTIAQDEFISLNFGVLEQVISHDDTPGGILVGEVITGGTSSATGIVIAIDASTITFEPTSFGVPFQSGETITSTSGSVASTSVPTATGIVVVQRPLQPFVSEFGWDNEPSGSGAPRWYHKYIDAKMATGQLTLRPGKEVMLKQEVWGRLQVPAETETVCVGNNLSDLIVPNTAARFVDTTIDFLTVPGGTPIAAVVTEMDISWTNNLTREPADNQSLDAIFLTEGDLDVTVAFKIIKEDNDLLDILRLNPFGDTGKVQITVTIDQTSGFFMEFDMPVVILKDMSHTLSESDKKVFESFGGTLEGVPVIDMSL